MSQNVTRTFQFNYPFWMDDMKDWLRSLPDSPDMENAKQLFAAMLRENESMVQAMRIIGADMRGYDHLASILTATPALAGNAIIAENNRRSLGITNLTPRASPHESLTPTEIDTQAHGNTVQRNSAQLEQPTSEHHGKRRRGTRGGKSVKAKQLRQQRPVAQTPSVVSSSKYPSPPIASTSAGTFISATSNSVDTPAQRLQQSHFRILQKMKYEEEFPPLPPTSTNKVTQSTTSPIVRRSKRLARANLANQIVEKMRTVNDTKGKN